MKDIFQNIYNGLLRFSPLKNLLKTKSGRQDKFPMVGFLLFEKKVRLENIIGFPISRTEVYEQALIHRSYLQVLDGEKIYSNERLEFLGDSVLNLVVTDYLFSMHTKVDEGELTKMRSWLVNKNSLALCAKKMNLQDFIMMSFSAERALKSGSDSILADAMEALIAAVYIDNGLEQARRFIKNTLLPILMEYRVMVDKNFKSILLEELQSKGQHTPVYNVIEEYGPDHDKEFLVGVFVEEELIGQGRGKSKKLAEQMAAKIALEKIEAKIKEDLNGEINF